MRKTKSRWITLYKCLFYKCLFSCDSKGRSKESKQGKGNLPWVQLVSNNTCSFWEEMPLLGTALRHYRVGSVERILLEMGGEQVMLWLRSVCTMFLPHFASVLCLFGSLRKQRHLDREQLPSSPLFPASGGCVCCWDLQLVISVSESRCPRSSRCYRQQGAGRKISHLGVSYSEVF